MVDHLTCFEASLLVHCEAASVAVSDSSSLALRKTPPPILCIRIHFPGVLKGFSAIFKNSHFWLFDWKCPSLNIGSQIWRV